MILPYVYKLTHKETGQFYIGFRCANKVIAEEDIGFKYFSSSKVVKELGFVNFNIEIIAIFFDSDCAYEFEHEMIRDNINNTLILNKHYCLGGVNKFKAFGMIQTEEAKENLRRINTGKLHSEETKYKISESLKGAKNHMFGKEHSKEAKNKIRDSKIGKLLSEEHKNKLSILKNGKPIHSEEYKRSFGQSQIGDKNHMYGKTGKNNKLSKPIIVNGVKYDSLNQASVEVNYDTSDLSKIVRGKKKLNKSIWQAEYINSIENVINE